MAISKREYDDQNGDCIWTYTPGKPGVWTADDSGCKDGCYCIDDFAPSASVTVSDHATDTHTTWSNKALKVKTYTVDHASFRAAVDSLINKKHPAGLASVPAALPTGKVTVRVPCAK